MEQYLVDKFLHTLQRKGKDEKTVYSYKLSIDHFIRYLKAHGIQSFFTVTTDTIHLYYKRNSIYAPSTAYWKAHVVYTFYQWLKEEGTILTNPVFKPHFRKRRSLVRNIPSHETIRNIFRKLFKESITKFDKRDFILLDLAYSSGLRRCELVRLNVSDILIEERTVRVKGKRGKERYVPIGNATMKTLLEYLYKTRPEFIDGHTVQALFVTSHKRRMNLCSVNESFYRLRKKHHIPESVTPQSLRCLCATDLLRNGAPLQDVSEILGHACLDTTRIYTKLIPQDLKRHHNKYHPRG
jgi:site-specific recombinase XerD